MKDAVESKTWAANPEGVGSLWRAIEKGRRSRIVFRIKREKAARPYREKRPYSGKPSTSTEARPPPRHGGRRGRWVQARPVGAGEANGGRMSPASCPSPPAPKTKEVTMPNL